MVRRRGFTIIEVLLALLVSLVVLSLLHEGQWLMKRNERQTIPAVEWYLALREIENPDHHFTYSYEKQRGDKATKDLDPHIRLTNTLTKEKYWLVDYNGNLSLVSGSRAAVVLIDHIYGFSAKSDGSISMSTHDGQNFKARLLLPRTKEGT